MFLLRLIWAVVRALVNASNDSAGCCAFIAAPLLSRFTHAALPQPSFGGEFGQHELPFENRIIDAQTLLAVLRPMDRPRKPRFPRRAARPEPHLRSRRSLRPRR